MNKERKYELLQWYPSLSEKIKKGDIVERPESTTINDYMHKSGWVIDPKEVENNPGFWKKIKEKNFEVLKEETKQYPRKDITSVKRLSDGKIFTVGRFVKSIHFDKGQYESIESFEIKNGYRMVAHTSWVNENPNGQSIEDLIPLEPIFTTEDGYDVFENDPYWVVFHKTYNLQREKSAHIGSGARTDATFFRERENAEKWLEENKPVFSKKDICKALEDSFNLNGFKNLLNL